MTEKKLSPWRIKQAEMQARLKQSERVLYHSGKRMVAANIWTKGVSYVKSEHGELKGKDDNGNDSKTANR